MQALPDGVQEQSELDQCLEAKLKLFWHTMEQVRASPKPRRPLSLCSNKLMPHPSTATARHDDHLLSG